MSLKWKNIDGDLIAEIEPNERYFIIRQTIGIFEPCYNLLICMMIAGRS